MIARAAAALAAAACAALALWLAAHHPISPVLAWLGCGLLALGVAMRPQYWLASILALLPLAGLMPWSGWIAVEELDLVVLAVAAAGYARLAAASSAPPAPGGPSPRRLAAACLWLLPLTCSTLLAMQIGFADAGGFEWGWWQGYREPMNGLRLAKPIAELALLLPLWRLLEPQGALALARRLSGGMLALLAIVSLAVLWERIAFPGLLNFSTDYRATGPFWEMHVGGAALDAALAASLPFAFAALAGARSPPRALGLSLLLVLGLYAALVTFSRIVLAAVPVGLLAWWWLRARSGARSGAPPGPGAPGKAAAAVALGLFALLALVAFPSMGYRGALALLAAFAVMLQLPGALRALPRRARRGVWVAGAVVGLLGSIAVLASGLWVPRSAYVLFAAATAATALALLGRGALRLPDVSRGVLALAGFLVMLAGLFAVGLRWGGARALLPAMSIVVVLVAALVWALARGARHREPAWPDNWRWQMQIVAAALMLLTVIGVLGGGDYMRQRLSAASEDSEGRQDHWSQSLQMLRGADWLVGKGLGRYAANRALSGRPQDQTGDYRLLAWAGADGGQAVVVSSGKHLAGWAEILRLSQRVAVPAPGPMLLHLELRTDQKLRLQAEVCEKHLLYAATCIAAAREIAPLPGVWQPVELELPAGTKLLTGGDWYAPRMNVFSVALVDQGQRAEIDNLRLVDAAGVSLLRNGDFESGLARWFFSSDRKHLPWHAKNLALHLLIEQGLFGLAAIGLALGAALWRTGAGAARAHPLAPLLFAALLSVMVVGAVDSLFDMPRISLLTLLLLAAALLLPAPSRLPQRSSGARVSAQPSAAA